MTVGQLIKKRLKELHMTQVELANDSGVALFTVSSVITDRHIPRFDTMCIIAKALNLSMNDIAEAYWNNR